MALDPPRITITEVIHEHDVLEDAVTIEVEIGGAFVRIDVTDGPYRPGEQIEVAAKVYGLNADHSEITWEPTSDSHVFFNTPKGD